MLSSVIQGGVFRRVLTPTNKVRRDGYVVCLSNSLTIGTSFASPTKPAGTLTASYATSSYVSTRSNQKVTRFNLPDHANRIQPSLTKIVATIGPTSEQEVPMQKVTAAGMNIMRLNFSHATKDEVELRCKNLKIAEAKLFSNKKVVGVLLDTKGPEIRTGKLKNDVSGHDTIHLEHGKTITLRTDDATRDEGSTATDLYIDYPYLSQTLKVGSQVLLDDGACILEVTKTSNTKFGEVVCTIQNSATLRSRAGVNLPLSDTSGHLPALSDKDKADILYGMSPAVDIDFIAASFVQSAAGVRDIRSYIEECATKLKYTPEQPRPLIISKIETASALKNFDDILYESDAIMVARGDLGVEIPLQQVTNAQKEMIAACNVAGKPCIVATQMLESMTKNPRPTRAEVADVTNAVYDGADAVMTSGETAKGKYPSETISYMQSILISAEEYYIDNATSDRHHPFQNDIPNTHVSVVAAASVAAANRTPNCQALLVLEAGAPGNHDLGNNLASLIAAYRPIKVPIIAVCTSNKIARQLSLYRGMCPLIIDPSQSATKVDDCTALIALAKERYHLVSGEPIIIVSSKAQNISYGGSSSMKITLVP